MLKHCYDVMTSFCYGVMMSLCYDIIILCFDVIHYDVIASLHFLHYDVIMV